MKGIWKGFYQYDKESLQKILGVEKTFFTINIDSFDGKVFKGTIEDDLETKGTPGQGSISGWTDKNEIKFVKYMPIKACILPDGSIKTYKGNHRPIYYVGQFNRDNETFKGTWKMKPGISFLGFLQIMLPTRGIWEMKKE